MIVGRLIPAGTGFAYHEDRRRTQEEILSEELKELEAQQQRAAQEAAAAAALAAGIQPAEAGRRRRPRPDRGVSPIAPPDVLRPAALYRRPAWIASPRPR